eukprot:scaffold3238_cov91-Cylindrotheca_fusiformis.AAC.3
MDVITKDLATRICQKETTVDVWFTVGADSAMTKVHCLEMFPPITIEDYVMLISKRWNEPMHHH